MGVNPLNIYTHRGTPFLSLHAQKRPIYLQFEPTHLGLAGVESPPGVVGYDTRMGKELGSGSLG